MGAWRRFQPSATSSKAMSFENDEGRSPHSAWQPHRPAGHQLPDAVRREPPQPTPGTGGSLPTCSRAATPFSRRSAPAADHGGGPSPLLRTTAGGRQARRDGVRRERGRSCNWPWSSSSNSMRRRKSATAAGRGGVAAVGALARLPGAPPPQAPADHRGITKEPGYPGGTTTQPPGPGEERREL